MNYPSVRLVFDRKHTASRTKRGLLQLEILYNRKRKWIGTGLRLFVHQWDAKSQRVRNSPTLIEDNEAIDIIVSKVKSIINDIMRDAGEFSFVVFENMLTKNPSNINICEYAVDAVGKRALGRSRLEQYNSVCATIDEWNCDITFKDFNIESIEDYNDNLIKRGLSASTIHNYHAMFRSIVEQAKEEGIITSNPYDRYKVAPVTAQARNYLTVAEVNAFANADIPSKLKLARDFFLVQCYTGLSYSDLAKVTANSIEERGDKKVIINQRKKTGVSFYVVLVKQAEEILKRHNYHFDDIPLVKLNRHLRKIAAMLNIEKDVTSHIGRHTFAVIALSNGVSIETVAKILGHTDIKTTQIYAKIVDATVEKSFEQLELVL